RAENIRNVNSVTGLLRVQQLVLGAQTQTLVRCQAGAQHRNVTLRASQGKNASFVKVGVDIFFRTYLVDFIDGAAHGEHQCASRFAAITMFEHCRRDGEFRGAPTAVASRGAEPDNFLLEYRHLQVRVSTEQVVSGPEAGVAAAKNCDVDVR